MSLDTLYEFSQSFIELKSQAFRRYFLSADAPLTEQCAILLGQRGIGKTTLIIQILLDLAAGNRFDPSILYIQADHFLVKGLRLFEIAESFHLQGGKYLALDEIHQYDNWSSELKSICDSFPGLKIIASGSSALEIHKGSHDLSRRAIVYRIAGMSLREFIALNHGVSLEAITLDNILHDHQAIAESIVRQLSQHNIKILPLFQDYLLYGYYPYYQEFKDVNKFKITLEQNIHTTLESDLVAIYPNLSRQSVKKMGLLLAFIARNVPYTPNLRNLKQFLEIGDERTLKDYLKYLEDSGLIISVYKASQQLARRNTPSKIYLQNPNLMQAIAEEQTNIGTLREVFFHNMLSKSHELRVPAEGDFIINDTTLIEIGGRKKDFKQIKGAENAYIASDDIEFGFGSKIPLWLFGFLY